MHVFMSYSHKDSNIAASLSALLRAHGIPVWIDNAGLSPGTPEWDKVIRAALARCRWVIVLCSENARESNYVAIELAIAESMKKTIFPVWIAGASWPQCAPMSLILSQYSDVRGPALPRGFSSFIGSQFSAAGLQTVDENWPFIRIKYENQTIKINPFKYKSRAEFLTQIFVGLVQNTFPPFSYGERWALDIGGVTYPGRSGGAESIRLLWLPAIWAKRPFEPVADHWISEPPDLWSSRYPKDVYIAALNQVTIIDLVKLRDDVERSASGSTEMEIEEFSHQPVGLAAAPEVFAEIVVGEHPKSVCFAVRDAARAAATSRHSAAFNVEPVQTQGVLVGSGIYFRSLTRRGSADLMFVKTGPQ